MIAMLRTNRDIRALFIAQVVSYMGDWFAYVAFVGLVQDLTDLPLLVTTVYICQSLPMFLSTAIAGATADRFDRRTIITVVSMLQTVAAAGLLLAGSRGTLWVGFVCLCVISALAAFVGPAAQASLPSLARDDHELRQANVLFGSLWGAMLAIGAAAGGFVASVFGRNVSFIVNAASFGIAAIAMRFIRRPMQLPRTASTDKGERMHPIADMREAFGYAKRDHALLALLASKATFAMGAGMVGLLALLATHQLHGGDGATGLLLGVRGVGAAVGPVIAAKLLGPRLSRLLLLAGFSGLAFGVFYLALSVTTTLWLAATLVLIAHLGGGAQWTLSTYGLQRRAPDHILGRVLAGDFGIVTLIITLSNLAAGALAGIAGTRWAFVVFSVLTLIASITYLVVTRPIRADLDVEHDRAAVDRSVSRHPG
ncbi:MAG: MFS transporter [Ilumatobacteraceae bacterium]